jgi:hypothetical protein
MTFSVCTGQEQNDEYKKIDEDDGEEDVIDDSDKAVIWVDKLEVFFIILVLLQT